MNKEIPNLKILQKLKEDLKQGKTLVTFTFLQTAGAVLGMAAPLVIMKFLSNDMWGRYSLCEIVIFFFSALLILSAKTPFIIFANQERNKTGTISRSFSIQCIFFAASVCLFLIVTGVFPKVITAFVEINPADLKYVAFAFFAFIMKDFGANLFMALNRRTANALLEFAFGTLTMTLLVVFYYLNWFNLKSIFLSYFIASLIILLICLAVVNFKMLLPLVFDRSQFKQMLDFTLWMAAGTVSSTVISLIGLSTLRFCGVSLDNIGQYSAANKFFKGFMTLIYIIPSYFLPHISLNIGNPEKIRAYLFHKRPRVWLLGLAGFAFAWLVIPYVLNLIYADKYNDAVPILRIMLIACVIFLHTAMYGPLFGALKIYKFQQIVAVTHLIVNLILSLMLIPRFGSTGAAIAIVLSYFYLAIVYEYYYRKKLKMLVLKI